MLNIIIFVLFIAISYLPFHSLSHSEGPENITLSEKS